MALPVDLRNEMRVGPRADKRLRVVELYAGTARSTEPFLKWPRCVSALLADNDPYAWRTYLHNRPGSPYLLSDLAKMDPATLLVLAGGRIDILLGCPPCQGFSDTGNRNPRDARNRHLTLFGEFAVAAKPLAIAMENVPLAADTPQFSQFLERIERVGYVWTAGILNSAVRGSSQCRQRLVFIGIRKDVGISPVIPDPTHGGSRNYYSYRFGKMTPLEKDPVGMLGQTPASFRSGKNLPYQERGFGKLDIPYICEVLDGLPRLGTKEARRLGHVAWSHTRAQLRRMSFVPEGGRWSGGEDHYSQSYGRLHRKGLARTITTFFPNPGSGRFWHPTANRSLTLREAARLQGYPDSFKFTQPCASRLVGNALDARVADVVYQVIRGCLE